MTHPSNPPPPQPEAGSEFDLVRERLKSWPDAPSPHLADRVLIAIRPAPWRQPLAIAAGVLALLSLTWFAAFRSAHAPAPAAVAELDAAREWMASPPAPEPVPDKIEHTPAPPVAPAAVSPQEQGMAWLIQVQDEDGGWAMGRVGAAANYTTGLTSLALLALGSCPESAARAEAVRRGLDYLLAQQDPATGLFGPDITGSLYNHTLACLALLDTHAASTPPAQRASLRAALDLLLRHQRPEGGWNYLRARASPPNSSLTAWSLLVLMEAEARGLSSHAEEIARGLDWLETTLDANGRAGYRRPGDHPHGSETLTAAAALCLSSRVDLPPALRELMLANVRSDARAAQSNLDYYRAYFQTEALREAGLTDAPEIARLTTRLEEAQDRTSEQAGSWSAEDPWARTGGRVYSTALAMLVLNER